MIYSCEVDDDSFLVSMGFLSGGWKEEYCISSYNQKIIKPIKVILESDKIIDIDSLLYKESLNTNDEEIAHLIATLYPEKIS